MKNKRLIIILSVIPGLLLIPLVAMQFTDEVKWTLFDFIVMFILLSITGLGIELTCRLVKSKQNRIAFCIVICLALILIWMELAVGIFGTPFAGS